MASALDHTDAMQRRDAGLDGTTDGAPPDPPGSPDIQLPIGLPF
jgi:hypothetical protein